jgi:hypothetical protein
MSRFEEFEQALRSKRWRYDSGEECFYDGDRVVEWEELICLVTDFTLDELASYQDDQYEKLYARRAKLAAGT